MKATFACLPATLNLSIDPGKPLQAYFPGGQKTVFNVTTIKFRDHTLISEDPWEIGQVKLWMKKHPEDGIKIIAEEKPRNLD